MKELIVEEARKLLGTPFHHQGRTPGVGVDCIGLLVCVGRAIGAEFTDCLDYHKRPDGATLLAKFAENLDPVVDPEPGDIALFYFESRAYPQHAGIITPYGLIHTYAKVRKVVEHHFDNYWKVRTHSYHRFRWQHSR